MNHQTPFINSDETPQCVTCSRYFNNGRCEAYPDGIPVEIMRNKVDHTEPYDGDRGLTYKQKYDFSGGGSLIEEEDLIIDDSVFDDPFGYTLCATCRHFRSFSKKTCDAFPDGIPNDILNGDFVHNKEYTGVEDKYDNGIVFESKFK